MHFASVLAFASLIASVLAGRYIVILRPEADLDRFLVKLEKKGSIVVNNKFTFIHGAVITTNDFTTTSLLKFREVLSAEEDKIINIDPILTSINPGGPEIPSPTEPTVHIDQ
ncbi:hypothetical protein CKAH01_14614 [Colletotrichum kahawae]|uniref:Uncharacterized protein n=1 Tax=Colletotrichum kahawae TaxID=34407 RepID=A0AAD9YM77_COLKA|nr:hypothetical protein CKAH01_14614 [Colletotrichum kahawae]